MSQKSALKRITLNLARSRDFPSGSAEHGYEFVAPLDAKGHIHPRLWHDYCTQCRVRRFWDGDDEQNGQLVHKPGGAEHVRWVFDYDPGRVEDDKSGYRFGAHTFAPGEYVSIADGKGAIHTFKVASVQPEELR